MKSPNKAGIADECDASRPERGTASAWFACYTRARHEKSVARHLIDLGLEVYVPVVPRVRQWHDRKRIVQFPLFPGYVFVRTSPATAPAVAAVS